jgi:hypothetical protein
MSDGMIISGITAVVRRLIATGVEIQDSGRIVKVALIQQALLPSHTVFS